MARVAWRVVDFSDNIAELLRHLKANQKTLQIVFARWDLECVEEAFPELAPLNLTCAPKIVIGFIDVELLSTTLPMIFVQ